MKLGRFCIPEFVSFQRLYSTTNAYAAAVGVTPQRPRLLERLERSWSPAEAVLRLCQPGLEHAAYL